MGLTKYKLGEFVEAFNHRCGIANLIPEQVSGISIDKEFFEPAKQVGEDTSSYKVVPPNYFACNLMHVGRDNALPVAMNHSEFNKYVSPAYSVFKLKNENIILKEYFYLFLKSSEKDRLFSFHTDSSIRQGLPWEDFCDIDITLPSISQQRKYVNVYLSLQNNLAAYQSKVEELKMVCDGLLSNLDNKHCRHEKIGNYIKRNQRRNKEKHYKKSDVRGFNNDGQFIYPMRLFSGDISSFKIIQKNDFVYNSRINSTIKKLSVALNNGEELIVSPAYESFYVSEEKFLYPYYLYMLLQREDFAKKVLFNSFGSSTVVFGFDELGKIEIPIPDISIQREIVNIHKCYIERQRIAEALKEQLKNICPVLIRGSLEE